MGLKQTAILEPYTAIPMRRLYILTVLLALAVLALGAWAGSLLSSLVRLGQVQPGMTPTASVVSRAEWPIPSATLPRFPPALQTLEPTTVSAIEPTVAPATEIAPPTAGSPPTSTPLPPAAPASPSRPIQVQADSVGGPVSVPNRHEGPRWVTLQVGHLHTEQLPSEQAHLTDRTGAFAAGVSEVEVNLAVSQRAAELLAQRGFMVDLLDAVVPVDYTTDLFLAIHADGNARTSWRGFKAVAPWVSVPESDEFVSIFYEEYGKASGLPADPFTSVAMADYYAFNTSTYNHAIGANVPAALIELGFVSNPLDRKVLTEGTDRLAWGIANAVDRWFRSGVVGATPSPYPSFSPTRTPTNTPTAIPTSTATPSHTPTPMPPEIIVAMTMVAGHATAVLPAESPSPSSKLTLTPTPVPTATPPAGIITADGRWLPPLAPNGRVLPPPGSQAEPVLLSEAADEPYIGADGRERRQVWYQYYDPRLGRSIWRKGPLLLVRP